MERLRALEEHERAADEERRWRFLAALCGARAP